eukprot:768028-Hanusia_phi.AAC.6
MNEGVSKMTGEEEAGERNAASCPQLPAPCPLPAACLPLPPAPCPAHFSFALPEQAEDSSGNGTGRHRVLSLCDLAGHVGS